MEHINPIEYGKLLAKVDALSIKVENMDTDIKELLALANKSKGGFFLGMAMVSAVSGFVAWFITTWTR